MPPQKPDRYKARDEYDGHANYRDSLAPRPPVAIARGFLRGLLAIGVCVTITWLVHKALYPGPGIAVIITGGFAALVGFVVGAFSYSWMNHDKDGEQKKLGFLDTFAVLLIVFAFAIPLSIERANEKRERQVRAGEMRAAELAREELLRQRQGEGVAKLRRLGRFAAPGIVPPEFEVHDGGISVRVTYRGSASTSISLSRVLPDRESVGGWKGCALWTDGPYGEGRYYGHFIDPGMTLEFEMYRDCMEEFRGAPLEYRVGEPTMDGEAGDRAWWSESAFARPEGREKETFARFAAYSARKVQTPAPVPTQPESRVAAPRPSAMADDEADGVAVPTEREPAAVGDVIQCRDAAGAVQYTQTYCPPGTTRIGGPARE